MNQFINQPVVDWAKQSLPQSVEVKLRYKSLSSTIIVVFAYVVLAVGLLWLPVAVFYGAVANFITKGWSAEVSGSFVCSGGLFLVLGGLSASSLFLPWMQRKKLVKFFHAEGVETRGGQKYRWENLYYLNYKKTNIGTRRNKAARATVSTMFLGVENITVELVFENGTAVVPPLISNQPQILGILKMMPVERR